MTAPQSPFLTLAGFTALWDGPALTDAQNAQINLLLSVASNWIYRQLPGISATDPAAQFVTYDVVSCAVRFQKYSGMKEYSRGVGHRSEGGAFADPMKALEFTDNHKQLLGIPMRSAPLSSCRPDDFGAQDQYAGWDSNWAAAGDVVGWDFWQYGG